MHTYKHIDMCVWCRAVGSRDGKVDLLALFKALFIFNFFFLFFDDEKFFYSPSQI